MTDKGWFPRRISYLAQLRNLVLEPLYHSSHRFDKVLFLNDVIFSVIHSPFSFPFFLHLVKLFAFLLYAMQPEDALRLLHTNDGQYGAACGLDYFRPHLFYDTFAMRDIDGQAMISIFFPFFPQGKTRRQFLSRSPKVQVKSCWNGMGISISLASPVFFLSLPSLSSLF